MTPMSSPGAPPKKSNTTSIIIVVVVVGGLAALCCVGTLAAIAIPNFLKFQARSKQAEAKSNLKAAWVAEQAYFAEKDEYSEAFEKIGFAPERNNRYLYIVNPRGAALTPGKPSPGEHAMVEVDPRLAGGVTTTALLADIPGAVLAQAGVKGVCPADCQVTIVAAGNIDTDAALDVWSVSTAARTIAGEVVLAGMPFHDVDDLAR